ncbi:MAG: 5-(carboxyamino)imidazole ribonucleotide synthase [Methyloligellaceae bacterium]
MTAEAPLPPGSTIGILGGGQLGRMLAMAAARLGLTCHIYSDVPSVPAFEVALRHTVAAYDDEAALLAFAQAVDVATVEFENVPAAALATVARDTTVFPPVRAVEVSQDRLMEKEFLKSHGIAVAPFACVDTAGDLEAAVQTVGTPALLKTRRLGYDGKGQVKLATQADLEPARAALADVPSLLEAFVAFEAEVSVLAVGGRSGAIAFYDPSRNRHEKQILAESRVPSGLPPEIEDAARDIAARIVDDLDYVGVLCVEMFYCGADVERPLMVNEIAPRVHNSGHWTIDACLVSQFENHIRAIAGWPLGTTARHSDAVMTNLIGPDVQDWPEHAGRDGVAVHLYGKREARPGRKMGHVTRLF